MRIVDVVALWICLGAASVASLAPLNHRISQAMRRTNEMSVSNNITQAHRACAHWKTLLCECQRERLTDQVQCICQALYASCLSRIGQDEQAVVSYDASLSLKEFLTEETLQEVLQGKAKALQRLMRYEEARNVFLGGKITGDNVCAAATCSLRLGDTEWAIRVLRGFCEDIKNSSSFRAQGMLGALLAVVDHENVDHERIGRQLAQGAVAEPLFSWIHAVWQLKHGDKLALLNTSGERQHNVDCHLLLAKANQSPFDFPSLIQLDNKVLLHRLLTSKDNGSDGYFWPTGFVLPEESAKLQAHIADSHAMSSLHNLKTWILKKPCGYGSHGNKLVTSTEAIQTSEKMLPGQRYLCQLMVEQPLLIEGRKFSLRIYVVYFSESASGDDQCGYLFVSDQGLVKLASVPYEIGQDRNDDRVHMTNSGREEAMTQQDLVYLRGKLDKAGFDYSKFWDDTCKSIRAVIGSYAKNIMVEGTVSYRSRLATFGIPKILGFDYVLDANATPFLIEVNRFPGLEARDRRDESVKRKVVLDAWFCAADRLGVDPWDCLGIQRQEDIGHTSLHQLL